MKRTAEAKLNPFFASALPVRLQMRTDLHLLRKAWHMVMGLMIAFIYQVGLDRMTGLMILSSVLGLTLAVEITRLRVPTLNETMIRLWSPFMRACEARRMSGTPHYLLSAVLAIAIFPKPVAVLSILYLACGDPLASLFGILYGNRSIRFANGKSLVGTMAGIVTCILLGLVFLKSLNLSDSALIAISVVGGIAGGTAELLPGDLDDNFTIPVVSGFVLWLAFILVGI